MKSSELSERTRTSVAFDLRVRIPNAILSLYVSYGSLYSYTNISVLTDISPNMYEVAAVIRYYKGDELSPHPHNYHCKRTCVVCIRLHVKVVALTL